MSNFRITDLVTYSNVDPVNDVLEIVDKTNNQNKQISRNNLLGITSTPVGINDTQVLTAKTLTAPTISSPILSGTITGTYTLAGTPTFPSSVVTLTGSQTLTNKVLTSPTINAPTITNASVTQDAVTGFTSANNGTVYGISVTGGVITSAAVGSSSIATGAQIIDKTKNPYKFYVRRATAQNTGAAAFVVLQCDTKVFDTGSNVDVVTNKGRFTAPIAGFYFFSALWQASLSGTFGGGVSLFKNGVRTIDGSYVSSTAFSATTSTGFSLSTILQLSAGDYVEAQVYGSVAVAIDVSAAERNYFQGFLVSAT